MYKTNDKKDITYSSNHRGYEIMRNNKNDKGTFISSMDTIINTYEEMLSKHNKVLIDREDIRQPEDSKLDNPQRKITRIMESSKREFDGKFKDSPHDPDITFIRSTEQNANCDHSHFHLLILANGNCIKNRFSIHNSLARHTNRIFGSESEGLVHRCDSVGDTGIMLRKDDPDYEDKLKKAIYISSYLAKVKGKEDTPKGTHRLTTSRKKKA